jgi:hypothetical protein
MTTIKISAENRARLKAKAIYPWKETGKLLPDGRYEIEVDDEVMERLQAISPDPDVAIETLFGRGTA